MVEVPQGLVLVEAFLNTLDERTFSRHGRPHAPADALSSIEGLSAWWQSHGLAVGGRHPSAEDLHTTVSLRAALRAALDVDAEGTDVAVTIRALAAFPLHLERDASGALRLVAASGVPGVGAIVDTVAVSVAAGHWRRVKLCASPDCRWAFYDTSRNGRGRWCSMEVCGNRHKTRTYRHRQEA